MNRLKQSVPDWCFLKDPSAVKEHYQRLKAIGFQGVEMVESERWPVARAAGLEILSMPAAAMKEGLNHGANHAELLPVIAGQIETAADNGIPHVILLSGNRAGQDEETGFANCVDAIRKLSPRAEARGVTLVFEMLNVHNHPDYQADNSRFGFELLEAVDSPALKVLYDVYHMHRMGENVAEDIIGHLNQVAHLHVAGSPNRDLPGPDQEIDYATLVRDVHAAGYKGYWGQEWICSDGDRYAALDEARALLESYAE